MLTKATIEEAQPRAVPYTLWDADLAGFGCRVFPAGRRAFIVQYRLKGSRKSIQQTLGAYGLLTLPEARKTARGTLVQAKGGHNPQAASKARRTAEERHAAALTVAKLAKQYIAALHAGTTTTKGLQGRPLLSPGYVAQGELLLNYFVRSYGNQDAASLVRPDIVKMLNDYTSGSPDKQGRRGNPGRPGARHNMLGVIRRMYRWGQRNDLVAVDPTQHIASAKPRARERVLSLDELAHIWHAAEKLTPLGRDGIRLLILTGQRCSEVAGMTWAELDLDKALWTQPSNRNKARRQHVVPLPPTAVAIIQARRAAFIREPATEDLVLPSLTRDGTRIVPIRDWQYFKKEIRHIINSDDWVLHDFRRSIVSNCAEAGGDLAALDSILNHASSATRGGVVGVYQRAVLLEPMRKMMTLWDNLLSAAINPPVDDTKVVPLRA
jgi:integrase